MKIFGVIHLLGDYDEYSEWFSTLEEAQEDYNAESRPDKVLVVRLRTDREANFK